MTQEQKIQLADRIIELVTQHSTSDDLPVMIGTLTKAQGLKGFEGGEVGHPVFEYRDRYIIYLTGPIATVAVPYFKETLRSVIQFTNK